MRPLSFLSIHILFMGAFCTGIEAEAERQTMKEKKAGKVITTKHIRKNNLLRQFDIILQFQIGTTVYDYYSKYN